MPPRQTPEAAFRQALGFRAGTRFSTMKQTPKGLRHYLDASRLSVAELRTEFHRLAAMSDGQRAEARQHHKQAMSAEQTAKVGG